MKMLIVDSYYDTFSADIYERNSGLWTRSYDEQKRVLLDACFGTSDFYSSNLNAMGHHATELIASCSTLQRQWARENMISLTPAWFKPPDSARLPWKLRFRQRELARIVVEQARQCQPDVIHFQDPLAARDEIVQALRPFTRAITAQVASHVPDYASFQRFDLVLTSFPHYVDRFRRSGVASEYFNLGFEAGIMDRVRPGPQHDVVFVGGLSRRHASRVRWLEAVARQVELEWWGYGLEDLEPDSPLRKAHRGNAWGLDMYDIFFNSRIVLNHHIDEAENNANNMRLYEATGVGALLLTDSKANLDTLFEPGSEVVAYADADECAKLVKYFLGHEEERRQIARAGQKRTLQEHTYRARMQQFVKLLEPILS